MKKLFFFYFIFLIIFAGITLAAPLSETTGTINTGDPLQATVGLGGTASAPTTTTTTTGGGGGGGAGAGGGAAVAVVTVTDLEEKLDFESLSGFSIDAAQGSEFSFKDSKGDKHTLTITKVYVDRVLLTITSSPITITVKIGETKEVDINNDGIKDIAIKLVDIVYGKAKLTFRKLAEKVELVEEIPTGEVILEEIPEEALEEEIPEEIKPLPYQTIIIIVIIVALAIVIYLIMKKRNPSTGF